MTLIHCVSESENSVRVTADIKKYYKSTLENLDAKNLVA